MKTLITNELFSDFIECRYRGYLKITGANGSKSDLVDVSGKLLEGYHSQAREHLLRAYRDEGKKVCTDVGLSVVLANRYNLAIDVTATDTNASVRIDALMAAPGNASGSQPDYIPLIFVNNEKVSKEDELRLALCASVLIRWHACRPSLGRILHGSDFRVRKVKLARALEQADKALEEIRALRERPSEPPPLHLNAHCPTCAFRNSCRATAIEKDDLSLLRGIKEKEIVKLRNKGIFTVTQLSYTFRPRKKSKRSNPGIIKYYHSLKALALREKRIYVVGKPELTITGTPVYIDVEGTPDRDSYYLIGLRIPAASGVQRSLWADDRADEENIWKEFLQIITTIENPQLFYYGSYETAFLRRLTKRYGDTAEDARSVVHGLMKSAQNILSVLYGRVYFPTYSNGLKDIASYLGFKWSIEEPSGQRSLALRREWKLTGSETAKQDLINYNTDDCTALEVVVKTLLQLIPRDGASPTALQFPNAVHVDSLKPQMPYRLGPVDFVLPELDQINKCAYWDYQRDRIYIRSNPRLRRVARRNQRKKRRRRILPVNITVSASRPWKCPGCASNKITMNGRHSKLLYDLRFTAGGVKRWVSKYIIDHYKCRSCGMPFASDVYEWTRHRYGLQLLAYVIHNIIELHIPQMKLFGSMLKLFDYDVGQPTINRLKRRAAELYQDEYEEIKHTLLHGKLIHADETHLSTKSNSGYVWVFTSMEEVVYLWSATREGNVAQEFLGGFNGVLVSDFYSVYDSISCAQQKCLVHLIRDLNDDVLKESFNEEMKALVHEFTALLKPVVDTIDRFGLKAHFLKKHRVEVARFYERLLTREYKTELARKAQDRFRRNQGKLFTFLDHDNVPWNNNNAEHAIKAFAALRNVIEANSTESGIRDYLVLLSVYQTCEYRGVDFLQFLRSGEKRVDDYVRKRHSQRSRPRLQETSPIRAHFGSDPTR